MILHTLLVPIIAVTAFEKLTDGKIGLGGFSNILRKPINLDQLQNMLKNYHLVAS